MTHRGNEDTTPSISPSTAMKYVFVLIWGLIPSNLFHGPFPYANTSGRKRERERESGTARLRLVQRRKHTSEDGSVCVYYEI